MKVSVKICSVGDPDFPVPHCVPVVRNDAFRSFRAAFPPCATTFFPCVFIFVR